MPMGRSVSRDPARMQAGIEAVCERVWGCALSECALRRSGSRSWRERSGRLLGRSVEGTCLIRCGERKTKAAASEGSAPGRHLGRPWRGRRSGRFVGGTLPVLWRCGLRLEARSSLPPRTARAPPAARAGARRRARRLGGGGRGAERRALWGAASMTSSKKKQEQEGASPSAGPRRVGGPGAEWPAPIAPTQEA